MTITINAIGGQVGLAGNPLFIPLIVNAVGGGITLAGSPTVDVENNAIMALIQEPASNYFYRKTVKASIETGNYLVPLSTVPGVTTYLMKTAEDSVTIYGTLNPLGSDPAQIENVPSGDWIQLATGSGTGDLVGNYTGFKLNIVANGDFISLRRLERRK